MFFERTIFRLLVTKGAVESVPITVTVPVRTRMLMIDKPKAPKGGVQYRRQVLYPEKYTVEPIHVRNLAGRDPVSGRVVAAGIGGGIKYKYHWIDWYRRGPTDNSPPQEEKVIKVIDDAHRTAKIALVAVGDYLKYILATENMKAGDVLKTSSYIPRNPVRAEEGDAFPLGALPVGTRVHCISLRPNEGGILVHSAGSFATILRHAPDNRVIIQLPSKREYSLNEHCMCTVGRLSNVLHYKTPIGSAQRNRELGNRPRSGLWKRKTGYHGRKIRPPKPCKLVSQFPATKDERVRLTML